MEKQETVAKRLRLHRAANGLSLGDVESVIGIPRSTLSRFECGRNVLDFDAYAGVCRYLDIPLASGAVTTSRPGIDTIYDIIRRDKSLTKPDADALIEVMSVAYKVFKRVQDRHDQVL